MRSLRTTNRRARRGPWSPNFAAAVIQRQRKRFAYTPFRRPAEVSLAINTAIITRHRRQAQLNIIASTGRIYGVAPAVEFTDDLTRPPTEHPMDWKR